MDDFFGLRRIDGCVRGGCGVVSYRAKNDAENLEWGEGMYPTMRMFQPDKGAQQHHPLQQESSRH